MLCYFNTHTNLQMYIFFFICTVFSIDLSRTVEELNQLNNHIVTSGTVYLLKTKIQTLRPRYKHLNVIK